MANQDQNYLGPRTHPPNLQKSTSFSGAKLHYQYTGKEQKTSSSKDESRVHHSENRSPHLSRQLTVDYGGGSTVDQRSQLGTQATFSPGSSRKTNFNPYDPGVHTKSYEESQKPPLYVGYNSYASHSNEQPTTVSSSSARQSFQDSASMQNPAESTRSIHYSRYYPENLTAPNDASNARNQKNETVHPSTDGIRSFQQSPTSSYNDSAQPNYELSRTTYSPASHRPTPTKDYSDHREKPYNTATSHQSSERLNSESRSSRSSQLTHNPSFDYSSSNHNTKLEQPNSHSPHFSSRAFNAVRSPVVSMDLHHRPKDDVTLATSTASPLSFSGHRAPPAEVRETLPMSSQVSTFLRGNESSRHSYSNPSTKVTTTPPIQQSHLGTNYLTTVQSSNLDRSPSPSRSRYMNSRDRRKTTTIIPSSIPQSSEYKSAFQREAPAVYYTEPQSTYKPLPMSSQTQNRNLTIGYTPNQFQEIERAQREFKNQKKQEEEIRAKLEAKKKAEQEKERAKREEQRRIEEAAKLEYRRRIEESQRLEAERLALEATMVDEDEDVAKFIRNLEERIKDSRDSKNLNGALVGRQINQSLAKNAENLTSAQTDEDNGQVEGHDGANDQKNMKTDQNANRKKYAEHYYDFDDYDDSELHSTTSMNSLLSTVTEEDPDSTSLNNHSTSTNPKLSTLQPSVISFIHDLVDGILSSLDKTDISRPTDTQHLIKQHDEEFYNNYQTMTTDTVRQFFTPQYSQEEATTSTFYNDSL
ncbi:Chromatin-remodeling ATPase INO80 [Caenorhabditis elegans]|uniref:Chromatin-remodeling ATPase INO80 n=1 Tax=Caenorhabditis elegans TaxID=6239 RepID=H2L062_CAEEL|nr:Chromatin-remodeling ATPase INO80 [Caenorhabditis elegans]CCD71588.1 Chromatin-remodeling ATPase INO80 [Caenorhabditis elegans]|eukprot:NP_001024951.1 Uncharacterized protein CELE_Y102A11A.2 [Caenorhabditis elegans]